MNEPLSSRNRITAFLLGFIVLLGTASCVKDQALVLTDEGTFPATDQTLVLIDRGTSPYVIRLTEDAGEVEDRAAALLQSVVHEMTGLTWPIQKGGVLSGEETLWIVSAGRSQGFPFSLDLKRLGEDGFCLERKGSTLIIAGGTCRGAYVGTARLLEQWGCRMYAPGARLVPRREKLVLGALHREEIPCFTYRETLMPNAQDRDFADWHGLHNRVDRARQWGLYVHTFDDLVPPDKFFAHHPEYFTSLKGLRVPDAQLCLSHEAVFALVKAGLKERMAKDPDALYWSVSQNDTFSPCECAGCKALDERFGGPSGTLLHFVNRVAREFPDKVISTLAYQYTRDGPRNIVPEPNVNIMLCTIECDRNRPLTEEEGEGAFRHDLAAWCALTDRIYLWDYVVQFRSYMDPFPNLGVLQPNIRFFRDHGVKMMFQQGSGGSISDFHDLKTYLIARLLWNPDADFDRLMEDFLNGFYGAAAPHVGDYIHACHEALADSQGTLDIYGTPWDGMNTYLTPERLARYQEMMGHAEEAVRQDPVLAVRVRLARLPLDYAVLEIAKKTPSGPGAWFERSADGIRVNEALLARLDHFVEEANAQHIKNLHERGLSPDQYREVMADFIRRSTEAHLALDKPVILEAPASVKYPAGGAAGLTDGLRGPDDYRCNWIGFEAVPFIATVDLEEVQSVQQVRLDFLQDERAWIFLPQCLHVEVSEDHSAWTPVGTLPRSAPENRFGAFIESYDCTFPARPARYIRVRTRHALACPPWHKGVGGKAWIFCDEIVVR